MDTLEILAFQRAVEQVLYSTSVGKSSLWLFGNICLFALFSAIILFFAVLNYRQRKIAQIEERFLTKSLENLAKKLPQIEIKKYSFYIEFVVAGLLFAFLTHISIFSALFIVVLYVIFRIFFLKKTLKLFKRKSGVAVPIGVYIAFILLYLFLLSMFNIMPAMIEISAELEAQQQLLQIFSEDW